MSKNNVTSPFERRDIERRARYAELRAELGDVDTGHDIDHGNLPGVASVGGLLARSIIADEHGTTHALAFSLLQQFRLLELARETHDETLNDFDQVYAVQSWRRTTEALVELIVKEQGIARRRIEALLKSREQFEDAADFADIIVGYFERSQTVTDDDLPRLIDQLGKLSSKLRSALESSEVQS